MTTLLFGRLPFVGDSWVSKRILICIGAYGTLLLFNYSSANMTCFKFSIFAQGSILLSLLVLGMASSAASPNTARWVSGTNVNLRSAASIDSEVLKRLAINTPLKLVQVPTQFEKFCEVETSLNARGFVACQYLSTQPTKIDQVSTSVLSNGKANPEFNLERAFWLNPSADALINYANFLTETRLTHAQKMNEAKQRPTEFRYDEKLKKNVEADAIERPKVAALEAMKEHLLKGIQPPPIERPLIPYTKIQSLEKLQSALFANPKAARNETPAAIARLQEFGKAKSSLLEKNHQGSFFAIEEIIALSKYIGLPPVVDSYFKRTAELPPLGSPAESISAALSVPHTVRTSAKPRWVPGGHYGDPHIGGAWDFGTVAVQLAKSVKRITIFRSGKLESNDDTVRRSWYIQQDDDACPEGFAFGKPSLNFSISTGLDKNEQPVVAKPRISYSGNALFYFYSNSAPVFERASVKSIRKNQKIALSSADTGNRGELFFSSSELITIDLDGDGIPDFAVWEPTGQSPNELHAPLREDPYLRYIFANVKGEWYLFGRDEYVYGCGC